MTRRNPIVEIDGVKHRRCIKCKALLPLSSFSLCRRNKYCQTQSICKMCMKEIRIRYGKNKEAIKCAAYKKRLGLAYERIKISELSRKLDIRQKIVDEISSIEAAEKEAAIKKRKIKDNIKS